MTASELEKLLIEINFASAAAKKITSLLVKNGKVASQDFINWVFNVNKNEAMERGASKDVAGESESDQLAKCMFNIERLRRELNSNQAERAALGYPPLTDERKNEISAEMKSRKKKCKEL